MTDTAAQAPTAVGGQPRRERELVTPEGVPVRITIAAYGERVGAVLIDLMIIVAATILFTLTLGLAALGSDETGWFLVIYLLIWFFLRNGYFICFELLWQGRTPGKRALGIRVVDRNGGRLKPQAIVVRNLMRELELFIPIGAFLGLAGGISSTGDSALLDVLIFVWVMIFAIFPLFNRERMRAGDFVAGAWVVLMPRQRLDADLTQADTRRRKRRRVRGDRDTEDGEPVFTRSQLEAYGEFELQTLERVLRATGIEAERTVAEVARRIRTKIAWREPAGGLDDRAFLEAYYTALRAHLENRMLFGRRRRDKHDRS